MLAVIIKSKINLLVLVVKTLLELYKNFKSRKLEKVFIFLVNINYVIEFSLNIRYNKESINMLLQFSDSYKIIFA